MFSFPSTVTRYPYVSIDAYHKVTYGTSQSLSCRYAKKDEVTKDPDGNDILTVAWVQFPLGTTVSKNDKIVLHDGTTAPVKMVQTIHYPHNDAEICIECYLGKQGKGLN